MPTPRPYVGGDGNLYQRSLTTASAGSTDDPDVAHFALNYSEESPITGATIPTGGIGIIGWLSAIWKFLNDRLTTLGQKTKAGSIPVTIASDQGSQLTPGLLSTTTSGTVTAGARSVTIKNIGMVTGTVLTVNLPLGESVSYVTTDGNTLGAIAYNATGTTFLISETR
jgi:hypothetical protein